MWRHKPDVKDDEKKDTQMEAMWYIVLYIKSASWICYEKLKFQILALAFLILLSVVPVYTCHLTMHIFILGPVVQN